MKKTVIAQMIALGLGSVLYASGFKGDCKHQMHPKDQMFKVMQQLDLTDAQKQALKDIRESNKKQRTAFKEAMREKRMGSVKIDMGAFMSANHFDKEAFKKQIRANMGKRVERMQKNIDIKAERRAEHMAKVFAVLTPEQREKWIQLSKN